MELSKEEYIKLEVMKICMPRISFTERNPASIIDTMVDYVMKDTKATDDRKKKVK